MAQRDSSYRNVMGGKLQLKGDLLPTINKTIKKKKKKKKLVEQPVEEAVKFADYKEPAEDKQEGEGEAEVNDNRTPAEIAYERAQQKRLADMAKKMANKSHREKIEEFNKRLANMSEHYDIPKVGPG